MKRVTIADTDAVDLYEVTAAEFMRTMLGQAPGAYAISDESRLCDFSSCGLPDDLADATAGLKELYATWDVWVVAEIERRYGLVGILPTILLVDLFERIEAKRRERLQ